MDSGYQRCLTGSGIAHLRRDATMRCTTNTPIVVIRESGLTIIILELELELYYLQLYLLLLT